VQTKVVCMATKMTILLQLVFDKHVPKDQWSSALQRNLALPAVWWDTEHKGACWSPTEIENACKHVD
jgi:hypothetical protein